MKNGPLLVIGVFSALAVSWGGIVLGTHAQLGSLTPYYDETEESTFPQQLTGIAAQGEQVYVSAGCVACHTQQVRRPDFGSDQARGWGERQSVARDYIFQARPQLGGLRYGPDLANLGARKSDYEELMKLLYSGSGTHPSYAFLFQTREIVGQRSVHALNLLGEEAPPAGYEVVPTAKAAALVGYLQGLRQGFEYPEARPVPSAAPARPSTEQEQQPAPAPNTEAPPPANELSNPEGKRPEQAIPAAAPDEKKKAEGEKQ